MSKRTQGFTLIELILVLVIIGFLTSLVAPAITSSTGLRLKTTVRRLAAGLRFARSKDKLFWYGQDFPIDLLLVRDDDIPRLLRAADVVVAPSLCEDACPYFVLESLAHGKTTIGSDIGGIRKDPEGDFLLVHGTIR